MASNGSHEDLCEIADYLANNTLLQAILIIKLVLSIVGLVFLAVLFKVQGTYLSFHSNARMLLIAHHLWSVLQCLATFGYYLFDVIRYGRNYEDACSYLMTTTFVVCIKAPSIITTFGQIWTLAAMAVERCWATAQYETYESMKKTLGIVLVILQWLLSLIGFLVTIAWLDWSEMKASATVSSGKTSTIFSTTLSVLGGVELLALATFCGLSVINRRIRKSMDQAELTVKYQLAENIRAIKLMIPMVVTHFCCFMPSLIIMPIYMKINPRLDPKQFPVFLEVFSFSSFYSDVLPVVLFWRHQTLRHNLRRAIKFVMNNGVEPMRADGRTWDQVRHFELLKQMWAPPQGRTLKARGPYANQRIQPSGSGVTLSNEHSVRAKSASVSVSPGSGSPHQAGGENLELPKAFVY